VVTPTADLVEPNLTDALADLAAADYTSTADGHAQRRQQVLVNTVASDLQSRAFIAHANADFPDVLRNDATRAERAAATDAAVVYFEVPGVPEPPPTTGPKEITSQVRVRVWKWHHRRHRGLTYALVDVTNVGKQTLKGPFVLGIHGLPAGASVVNATGTIASMPAVPVPWSRQLRPHRTLRAWVVVKGVPSTVTPKVRVFAGGKK
jgi:hypothetical protein